MTAYYTGRGINAGPATEFYPFSNATASIPSVLITATAAPGTTIHLSDANAQDVIFVTYSNVSAGPLTVFTNLGSVATTGQLQTTLSAGASAVAMSGNAAISKTGALSAWTTATTGIFAYGYVARTYTATG